MDQISISFPSFHQLADGASNGVDICPGKAAPYISMDRHYFAPLVFFEKTKHNVLCRRCKEYGLRDKEKAH